MSLSGTVTMGIMNTAVRMIPAMKMTITDVDTEREKARIYNEKHSYVRPKNGKALYKELTIAGYPCLIIRTRKKPIVKEKAIMYLHGGMRNSWKEELGVAKRYADCTGMDVWYPIYPSVTEVPITQSIDVIYAMYRKMVRKYGAEKIALMGCSFGGQFAFEVINWNNRSVNPVGMPALLIALSPWGVPNSEEDWNLMREYSKKDPILDVKAMELIKDVCASFGEDIPGHALHPIEEDFHNAPPTYVYYAEETCAGNSAAYVRAYERDGAGNQMHMHIEPGMMHGYACMPVFPESKRSYREQLKLLHEMGTGIVSNTRRKGE